MFEVWRGALWHLTTTTCDNRQKNYKLSYFGRNHYFWGSVIFCWSKIATFKATFHSGIATLIPGKIAPKAIEWT